MSKRWPPVGFVLCATMAAVNAYWAVAYGPWGHWLAAAILAAIAELNFAAWLEDRRGGTRC